MTVPSGRSGIFIKGPHSAQLDTAVSGIIRMYGR